MGRPPIQAADWTWKRRTKGSDWTPQGRRIGWVSGGDLFLEPRASYDVAQEMAGPELLPMGEQVIRNRLRQRGFLINVDVGLQMPQVRRPLEG